MRTTATALLCLLLPLPALANPVDVHVLVLLPYEVPALIGAEFRIENLPYDECIITESWNSGLTIGEIGWGFGIAFTEPQPGPIVHLGTLSFFAHTDVGEDYLMHVGDSFACDCLVVIDDLFVTHDAYGWGHTFNCSQPWGCECYPPGPRERQIAYIGLFADLEGEVCYQDLIVEPTPTQASSWGSVKSLY